MTRSAGQSRGRAQRRGRSVVAIVESSLFVVSLFGPGVAMVVIAEPFPITGLVLRDERDRLEPLCALPRVKQRHNETGRPPVIRIDRLAIMPVGDEGILT